MSGGDWKDLYRAAVEGDLGLVKHHIKEGIDPNFQHAEVLRTPLVASLVEGHVEVARYLLGHGADPSLVSELDDMAPLQAARQYGHHDVAALLVALGARVPRRPFWWRWLPI